VKNWDIDKYKDCIGEMRVKMELLYLSTTNYKNSNDLS
jgi:hypothetical protein